MIERLAIEPNDIRITPRMIRMAGIAFLFGCIRLTSVQSPARQAVRGNLLVTRQAEPRLRPARERLVAIAALLLELGMTGDQRRRHHELLEYALRLHRGRHSAGHDDPDRKPPCESSAQCASLHLEEVRREDVDESRNHEN